MNCSNLQQTDLKRIFKTKNLKIDYSVFGVNLKTVPGLFKTT